MLCVRIRKNSPGLYPELPRNRRRKHLRILVQNWDSKRLFGSEQQAREERVWESGPFSGDCVCVRVFALGVWVWLQKVRRQGYEPSDDCVYWTAAPRVPVCGSEFCVRVWILCTGAMLVVTHSPVCPIPLAVISQRSRIFPAT